MARRTSLVLLLSALATTGCLAAAVGAPPIAQPGITATNVNSTGGEPHVFLTSSGAILIGDSEGIWRSTNGGLTWTDVTPTLVFQGGCGFSTPVPSVFCDGWVLAEDAGGKLYATTTNGPEVNLATSTNGGATWNVLANLAAGADGIADRPWLAGGAANQVAIIWNSNGFRTSCAMSNDGGLTFVRSTSPIAGVIAGSAAFDSQGNLGFGIPGRLYRWPTPCLGLVESDNLPAHGQGGLQQQVAIDASDRYYAPQPAPGTNAPIHVVGVNGWNAVQKTVSAAITGVNSVTMPAIDERNGQIAVSFFGSSASGDPGSVPNNAKWDVYLVRITNFWTASPTVTTTKVTASPVHTGPICLDGINCSGGRELWDYQSVAIDAAGAVHLAWTHDPAGITYAKVP